MNRRDEEHVDLGIDGLEEAVVIGRGGFSTVYSARHSLVRRTVAVKVLNRLDSPADRRRFERECEVMGRMSDHPNVVTVHHAGYANDGRPYVLMELVPGGTLADLLARQGPVAWPRAVDHVIQVCGALERAHAEQILHRDIKPENILLDGDVPKLGDFGIAYLRDATGATSTHITASWLHTAPETFENKRDERSDIYSLGSTLHNLIAGQPPFWRPDDDSLNPLLMRLMTEPAPPLAPELAPPDLAAVVLSTLAKDPGLRPQSARALAEALGQAVGPAGDQPIPPAPSPDQGPALTPVAPQRVEREPVVPPAPPHLAATVSASSYQPPTQVPPAHPVAPPPQAPLPEPEAPQPPVGAPHPGVGVGARPSGFRALWVAGTLVLAASLMGLALAYRFGAYGFYVPRVAPGLAPGLVVLGAAVAAVKAQPLMAAGRARSTMAVAAVATGVGALVFYALVRIDFDHGPPVVVLSPGYLLASALVGVGGGLAGAAMVGGATVGPTHPHPDSHPDSHPDLHPDSRPRAAWALASGLVTAALAVGFGFASRWLDLAWMLIPLVVAGLALISTLIAGPVAPPGSAPTHDPSPGPAAAPSASGVEVGVLALAGVVAGYTHLVLEIFFDWRSERFATAYGVATLTLGLAVILGTRWDRPHSRWWWPLGALVMGLAGATIRFNILPSYTVNLAVFALAGLLLSLGLALVLLGTLGAAPRVGRAGSAPILALGVGASVAVLVVATILDQVFAIDTDLVLIAPIVLAGALSLMGVVRAATDRPPPR